MLTYVIPTRDRPARLRETLNAIEALGDHASCGGAEVVVVDNASDERLVLPRSLRSGVAVKEVLLPENLGAAARNHGASAADPRSSWIVMLDDDSFPRGLGFLPRLAATAPDVGAVSADIFLETRDGSVKRESGGLPEVFVGCGVAIRREVIRTLGGYDPAFGYYVEEYDLAARMLLAGWRVVFEPAFRVTHAKVAGGRDMDVILRRLVRNNGWVAQRYAPEAARASELREVCRRYRKIARKERALAGYGAGLAELRETIGAQVRREMPLDVWDRFTGLAWARRTLLRAYARAPFSTAEVVDEGKNAWAVKRALQEMGVRLTGYGEDAEVRVIGTLSPGPMLDALEARTLASYPGGPRLLAPWDGPLDGGTTDPAPVRAPGVVTGRAA
ncbi:MAG: glycosyltransferase [Leptolyngbya sp. PLA1]|nr:glycosyltransferase [Leptolyngbya sp. PLA1]